MNTFRVSKKTLLSLAVCATGFALAGPASASDWTFCSKEKASCEFDGIAEVRYGKNGTYDYGTFEDGVWCGNANFDDPLPGTFKQCEFRLQEEVAVEEVPVEEAPAEEEPVVEAETEASGTETIVYGEWTYCSREKDSCEFDGLAEVRYGKNGTYDYGTFEDGVWCGNANFDDPLSGTFKQCDYRLIETQVVVNEPEEDVEEPVVEEPVVEEPVEEEIVDVEVPATTDWIYCSREKASCEFDGLAEVRYGANGAYNISTFEDGVWCGNANFGDPISGTFKSCYYRLIGESIAVVEEPVVEEPVVEEPVTEEVVNATLAVSWTIPQERTDGASLYPYELAGYLLQYKGEDDEDYTSINVGDGLQTDVELVLPAGTYQVRIKAIDSDGLGSEFSQVEEITAI